MVSGYTSMRQASTDDNADESVDVWTAGHSCGCHRVDQLTSYRERGQGLRGSTEGATPESYCYPSPNWLDRIRNFDAGGR